MLFSAQHDQIISDKEIRRALAAGEFSYVYQPKVSLSTNSLCGAEALLRWDRQGVTIMPSEFIPQAEKSSLVSEINNAMLPVLINDIQTIESQIPGLFTSFNASARDFSEGSMIETLIDAIADGKVRQGKLGIEVTETSLVDNIEALEKRFHVLLDAGVALAMDDFGKGYSSIDMLSRLPFTTLKLDSGMIRKLGVSRKVEQIVESVCAMAKKIGMKLVAEGVESRFVYTELARHGCDYAQGFWISHPLPLPEYIDFALKSHTWAKTKIAA